jgi:hypothetical protein
LIPAFNAVSSGKDRLLAFNAGDPDISLAGGAQEPVS